MTNTLETGGSERQFVWLSQALRASNFRVDLGCLGRRGALVEQVGEISEFAPGGSFLTWQAQQQRLKLIRHLRRQKISIAHSFDFYSNVMLIPAAWLAGVPVIIGSHRQIGDLLSKRQFLAQKHVFRLCDRVVCNSQAAAESLRVAGMPEKKLAVIGNGLPPEAFCGALPASLENRRKLRVGMIARMSDRSKNHAAFMKMAAKLVPTFPESEFVLVGDGRLRADLEADAKQRGLADHVIFLGERQDIAAVLASLDVSVLTSSSESLSNVILESMAAGLPVVATDAGGNRELVREGESGFLVSLGDEAQLVAAVGRLLADRTLRQEVGMRARERAMAEFANDKIRKRYEELYLLLLAAKGLRNHA